MANKYELARIAYSEFMDIVLPGWENDTNSKDTPMRVAKAFIDEYLAGIKNGEPKVTFFDNEDNYDGIVFSGEIDIRSLCSHHHAPFFGKVYIAYIPDKTGKIVGLSKLNRIADHFSRKAQVQENLTMQIHNYLSEHLEGNLGVAVYMECTHTCVSHRGIQQNSIMKTAKLSGYFFNNEIGTRQEFYSMINNSK